MSDDRVPGRGSGRGFGVGVSPRLGSGLLAWLLAVDRGSAGLVPALSCSMLLAGYPGRYWELDR